MSPVAPGAPREGGVELSRAGEWVAVAYQRAVCGDLDEATRLVQAVRAAAGVFQAPVVVAEAMLVEGVIATYRGDLRHARDRLDRVAAFVDRLPGADLAPLARGWRALVAYNESRLADCAALLARALQDLPPRAASPRTRLRLATVASLLCAQAGADDAARGWLLAARLAATALEVRGALSPVIFDLAVASLERCCFERLRGMLDPQRAEEALLRVRSAIHYDAAAGVGAQASLHLLALGIALNLSGRHADACIPLTSFLDAPPTSRPEDGLRARTELAAARLALDPAPLDDTLRQSLASGLGGLTDPVERASLLSVLVADQARRPEVGDAPAWARTLGDELDRRHAENVELGGRLEALQLLEVPADWLRSGEDT